jgi:uncharacterized repeat protein (TIGR01451 family)
LALGIAIAFTAQISYAAGNEPTAPQTPAGIITIGDYVWHDQNVNGLQDDGPNAGIDGVNVYLYRDNGDGIFDPATDQLLDQTVTGDDPGTGGIEHGWYEFGDIVTGNYWVYIPPQAILDGYELTSSVTYYPNPAFVVIPTNPSSKDDVDFGFAQISIDVQKTVYLGNDNGASCPGQEFVTGMQGDDVVYCFEVTNTGQDASLGFIELGDLALGITVTDMTLVQGSAPLGPGESLTYAYQTTLDGALVNTVIATAFAVDEQTGFPIPGVGQPTDSDSAEVDQFGPSAIDIEKTVYVGHDSGASCPGFETVTGAQGTAVTYCFAVTNTGQTRLDSIEIDDADLGIDETDMTLVGSLPLEPNQSVVYYYETTMDGSLVNTASVTATPVDENGAPIPDAPKPTDEDTAAVEQVAPAIDIQKSVYLGHDAGASCPGGEQVLAANGSDVTYCFEVTNTGDTYLDDVTIDDPDLGIDQDDMVLISGSLPLGPNQHLMYFYTATINGDLTNTASVSAQPVDEQGAPIPNVDPPTDEDTAEVDEIAPAIEIQKTVYAGHDAGASCPGDEVVTAIQGTEITYCFTVTNTGDTYLDDVTIDDLDLGIDQSDMTLIGGSLPLGPNQSISYYYETAVNGDLTNTASASAQPVDEQGAPIPGVDSPIDEDTAEVDEITPAIEIQKTVYAGHDSGASCPGSELVQGQNGADVTYCFSVTNTGDAYLDLVKIDDSALGVTQTDLSIVSGAVPLAPGESIVYYYESTINGDLLNTATVEATPTTPDGEIVPDAPKPSDADTAEVNGLGPSIRIEKTVILGESGGTACPGGETVTGPIGAAITYCFEVINTGNTYLDNISITDPNLGITQDDMTLLSGTTPLAPGESLIYYYETTITEALRNTATVTADPTDDQGVIIPDLPSPSDADTADVTLTPTGTVGDFVWNDLNTNGIQDPGEPGVANVVVQLYDSDGNLIAETTTDENGFYEFTDVEPGQYYVQFTPPADTYYFTQPYQGSDPGADSDANPNTGRTDFFIVDAGVNDPTHDAGLIQNPTLVLLKTANVALAGAGDSVSYILSFTNDGPGPALDVILTEHVPDYTTFDAGNSTPGWSCPDGSLAGTLCEFHYGALGVGDSDSVIFAVIIDLKLPEGALMIENVALINDILSEIQNGDHADVPIGPPNAITLETFDATIVSQDGADVVQLDWVTSAEIDTLGFHLYRSTQTTVENAVKLTPSLISGQGSQGGSYSFADRYALLNIRYYYWLVELETGGTENWHGPVSALIESASPAPNNRLFLPLITNR